MKSKDFFRKFMSLYLWGNLLAMAVVVCALFFGVKYGLNAYTRHDESIPVPDLTAMDFNKARTLLEMDELRIEVSDSGYNKRLPAHCILSQTPMHGTRVKRGRIIYVTVNAPSSPTVSIPDVIDNCSRREAEAKLTALGFRMLEPKYVAGEKDWVMGLVSRGRDISTGDRISTEYPLMLILGNGAYDNSDDYENAYPEDEEDFRKYMKGGTDLDNEIPKDNNDYKKYIQGNSGVDDFEEVTEPQI